MLMTMAAVAQLWPVHLSVKMKLTVDDTATFAAALLLGPFYAMVIAGGTTLVAHAAIAGFPELPPEQLGVSHGFA